MALVFLDGARRLVEDSGGSRVGLLYVVFSTSGKRARSRGVGRYVDEAMDSARRAKQLNPTLPAALATNANVRDRQFDHIVSLNGSKSLSSGGWAPRLVALGRSPFELTLALDSSVMVCSSTLHAELLAEHRRDALDFAVNFGESPLSPSTSSVFGSPPSHVEDVLPHNFAMLIRKGAGFHALRQRWARALPVHFDDQKALRAALRGLEAVKYLACEPTSSQASGGCTSAACSHALGLAWQGLARQALAWQGIPQSGPPQPSSRRLALPAEAPAEAPAAWPAEASSRLQSSRRLSAKRAEASGAPRRAGAAACVHVRVRRLTERFLGFKSADKTMPGWKMVPPRCTDCF